MSQPGEGRRPKSRSARPTRPFFRRHRCGGQDFAGDPIDIAADQPSVPHGGTEGMHDPKKQHRLLGRASTAPAIQGPDPPRRAADEANRRRSHGLHKASCELFAPSTGSAARHPRGDRRAASHGDDDAAARPDRHEQACGRRPFGRRRVDGGRRQTRLPRHARRAARSAAGRVPRLLAAATLAARASSTRTSSGPGVHGPTRAGRCSPPLAMATRAATRRRSRARVSATRRSAAASAFSDDTVTSNNASSKFAARCVSRGHVRVVRRRASL